MIRKNINFLKFKLYRLKSKFAIFLNSQIHFSKFPMSFLKNGFENLKF